VDADGRGRQREEREDYPESRAAHRADSI
jgi:hypothetical protein